MDGLKIIKTEQAYDAALEELDQLLERDPLPDTPEADRLDVLALLIKTYEGEHYKIELPDPVSAIKFRMEQAGLKNQDLVPFIGSKSRVSEILNGKRDLTLKQARALHHGLGLPAEVMLQEFAPALTVEDPTIEWEKFPVNEMIKRGWLSFAGSLKEAHLRAEELVRPFLESVELSPVICRRGQGGEKDPYALLALRAGVYHKVSSKKLNRSFVAEDLTAEVVQGLVKLSALEHGPAMVVEYLNNYGIHFLTVKHFDKTHLDGASMLLPDGTPVIVLTLRHDRLDNFWFTLLHELAHVKLHLSQDQDSFYDDLDAVIDSDPLEDEANVFASEALLPNEVLQGQLDQPSKQLVACIAYERGISPAIVAGRIRKVKNNFRLFHNIVGRGQVREQFAEFEF